MSVSVVSKDSTFDTTFFLAFYFCVKNAKGLCERSVTTSAFEHSQTAEERISRGIKRTRSESRKRQGRQLSVARLLQTERDALLPAALALEAPHIQVDHVLGRHVAGACHRHAVRVHPL